MRIATLPIGIRFMTIGMQTGTVGNDDLDKGMLSLPVRKRCMA